MVFGSGLLNKGGWRDLPPPKLKSVSVKIGIGMLFLLEEKIGIGMLFTLQNRYRYR